MSHFDLEKMVICCVFAGSDDQLAAAKTDAQGNYELTGGIGSLFGMNVHFKVYHDCDDGVKPCQRKVNFNTAIFHFYIFYVLLFFHCCIPIKWEGITQIFTLFQVDLKIPDQYITRTSDVQKWFDAGTMNMEFHFPDEERSCIN